MLRAKLGQWLESKAQVRAHFREYRKGILRRNGEIAIIFAYRGARRVHYGDELRHRRGDLVYIGEGKRGHQTLTAGNQALIDASRTALPVKLFLDCGDVFTPKKLLYAGEWRVESYRYGASRNAGRRKLYHFRLRPHKDADDVLRFLSFTFAASGTAGEFESELRRFARARHRFYSNNKNIIRSQDNVIGEIGEYFAIKEFNKHNPSKPLIRLQSATKDVDAIQIGTGNRFAIKTVGEGSTTTSNIWSANIAEAVDSFLLVQMNRATLQPQVICQISSRAVRPHLRKDNYQGSTKIVFDENLLKRSHILMSSKSKARR